MFNNDQNSEQSFQQNALSIYNDKESKNAVSNRLSGTALYENPKTGERLGTQFINADIGAVWTSPKGKVRFFVAHRGLIAIIIALIFCITLVLCTLIKYKYSDSPTKSVIELIHDFFVKSDENLQESEASNDAESITEVEIVQTETIVYKDISEIVNQDGFIFPYSDLQAISIDELENVISSCSSKDLEMKVIQWAINEMEARHGYDFGGNPEYYAFISQYGWYNKAYVSGQGHFQFEGIEEKNFLLLANYRDRHY